MQWSNSGLGDLTVSVNLSPREFRGRSLLPMVSQALVDSGLDAERLLGELDGGRALLFPSGMAAICSLAMATLAPGATVAIADGGYYGTLGLLLLCLGAGSIATMPLAGALAARFGCRRVIWGASLVICAALPLLATAGSVPLLAAALDNGLRRGDRALTGPVSRGDVGTVRDHLGTLTDRAPGAVPAYVAMAQRTTERALAAGRLRPADGAPLLDLLHAAAEVAR